MSNRILDYPEATAITSNDYILLDNEGTGAKCIKASALNINMDNYTIKEARGAIASFDDGEDLPLAFMGAYITALQDLHGYDYPWVGGSGRNLFNMGSKWSGSASGLSFTTDDDYVTMNGTKSGANYVTPSQLYFDLPAGTYYAKAFVISGTTSNAPSIYVYSNQELTSNMLNTERSFTIESQTSVGIRFAFWNDGATYSDYKIGIVISKSYDIDKFYPYSNECPIIGFSGVEVSVVDENLIDITSMTPTYALNGITYTINSDGSVIANGTATARSQVYWSVPQDTAKTFANKKLSGCPSLSGCSLFLELNASPYTNYATDTGEGAIISSDIANATTTVNYVIRIAQGTTVNNLTITPKITDEMNTYSLTFTDGTNPLIVYYGTVDLISGLLTINKCGDDMGNMNYTYQSLSGGRNGFSVSVSDMKETTGGSEIIDAISSCYKATNYNGTWANGNMSYFYPTGKTVIFINNDYTDASTFKTAMTGQQFVYPLATPLTYQLSKQQIRSLVGVNNIFANTGDSIVDYRKLWVKPEM